MVLPQHFANLALTIIQFTFGYYLCSLIFIYLLALHLNYLYFIYFAQSNYVLFQLSFSHLHNGWYLLRAHRAKVFNKKILLIQ